MIQDILEAARGTTRERALRALEQSPISLQGAAALLSAPREAILDELLVRSHAVTDSVFHHRVLVLSPCYLSSFCVNGCVYCRYNAEEAPARRWISPLEVGEEVAALARRGVRRVVLVAGEDHNAATPEYIAQAAAQARRYVPEVDLAVGSASQVQYREWREAGADGVFCFQETYDHAVYAAVHPAGHKSRVDERLAALERAGRAGMSRLGLGILLGLGPPAADLLALIAHARRLGNLFPSSRLTVALPRLDCAGGGRLPDGARPVEDEELLRLFGVLRLALPEAGLIAFPREPEWMRGRLLSAGVTQMTPQGGVDPGAFVECLHDDGIPGTRDDRTDLELIWDLEDLGYHVVRDEGPEPQDRARFPEDRARFPDQGTGRAM
jgi:2-iminoacetate synthase